jgi:NhaA family Na+:H+ antiporter
MRDYKSMQNIFLKKIQIPKKYNLDLFKEFIESEKSSGYLLVLLTIISMLIANSSLGKEYIKIFHSYLDLSFSTIQLNYNVEQWINDGLMTVFFLLVGLEIEREIYVGELSTIKKAGLPVIAAAGGMLIPAVIHLSLNIGTPTQRGFGIPMATDIAFTLGILSLLGNRVPVSIKIFLTALAIIDDLGAIIIIAVFYTNQLSFIYLLSALGIFAFLIFLNKKNVNSLPVYLIMGIIMWYAMLKSGVHPTITGVLLAFAIPFRKSGEQNISYSLQKWLHKPVAFFILPLFAIVNTAIEIPKDIISSLTSANSAGIITGLVAGKLIGIFTFTYLAVKLNISILPKDLNWRFIAGASCLAGIGFTMSIFITNLAFMDPVILTASKLSIIFASTISAIIGATMLKLSKNQEENS